MSEETAVVEPPARSLGPVKVIGILSILGGIALIVVGIVVWIMVSSQLRAENITIPDDAMAFQGQTVQGPFTAYVQADIIQHHALEASGGKTYAELPQDDPIRATMMNASFLRASLFTSVVSFGVAAFAMGVGILFILLGWAAHRLASAPVVLKRVAIAGASPAPDRRPVDPLDALTEIATLLERERASRYRSKAFRAAAEVVQGLPPEVLADPARLRRVKGIGDSTFAVISQAIAGRVPDYLAELRERYDVRAGGELRARLRGDLHSHSDWSDGLAPIELMVETARGLGHEYLALTDHSPRLRVANGLSPERLREQLALVPSFSGDGFTLLSGIEVDILDAGALDQEDELLERVDVVVASVHSKLRMERGPMTRRMIAAVAHPRTRVLGHVTGRLVEGARGTRPPSDFDPRAVFEACASHDVAVEINSRPERQDPPDELIGIALEAGCLFSIDSDAHAPGQLSLLDYGAERADRLGVPVDRIVTTWPLDRLRGWLRGGGS